MLWIARFNSENVIILDSNFSHSKKPKKKKAKRKCFFFSFFSLWSLASHHNLQICRWQKFCWLINMKFLLLVPHDSCYPTLSLHFVFVPQHFINISLYLSVFHDLFFNLLRLSGINYNKIIYFWYGGNEINACANSLQDSSPTRVKSSATNWIVWVCLKKSRRVLWEIEPTTSRSS